MSDPGCRTAPWPCRASSWWGRRAWCRRAAGTASRSPRGPPQCCRSGSTRTSSWSSLPTCILQFRRLALKSPPLGPKWDRWAKKLGCASDPPIPADYRLEEGGDFKASRRNCILYVWCIIMYININKYIQYYYIPMIFPSLLRCIYLSLKYEFRICGNSLLDRLDTLAKMNSSTLLTTGYHETIYSKDRVWLIETRLSNVERDTYKHSYHQNSRKFHASSLETSWGEDGGGGGGQRRGGWTLFRVPQWQSLCPDKQPEIRLVTFSTMSKYQVTQANMLHFQSFEYVIT